MKLILKSAILLFFSLGVSGQDFDLLGIIDDQMVRINSSSNDIEVIGNLNPTPPELVRFLTYVEEECLVYGIMNSSAAPTLVSIDMDLNFTVIGLLTLPGNTVYFCESIAFNSTDNTLYASASIDGNQSMGDYSSEAILEVDRGSAACQFKTEITGNVPSPDIDKMTFCGSMLYFFDGQPGQWGKYFEFDFVGIGVSVQATELASYGYVPIRDNECLYGNYYFTTGRDLSFFNTSNYSITNLGNLFGPSAFGGEDITGICVNPFPDYLNLEEEVVLCDEDNYLIELDYPYADVTWNNGATGSSLLVFDSGTYWADVVYNNCVFRTDTIEVTFLFPTQIDLGQDILLCEGETTFLSIDDPNIDVVWSDGTIGNVIVISEAGTYWAEVSQDGCTFITESIEVTLVEGVFGLGEDVTLCEEESYTITIEGAGQDIIWNNGDVGNDLIVTESGLYWADIALDNCLFRTDTILVEITEPLDNSIGDDSFICSGETVTYAIDAPNIDVVWSDGSTGDQIVVSEAGIYWAQYMQNGCTYYSDTVQVEFIEAEFNLGQDIILCYEESYSLMLEGAGPNVSWNNGFMGNPIEITEAGTYWANVYHNNCEFQTDTIEVTMVEPLDVTLGVDTVICNEDNIVLSIDEPDVVINWSDGSVGNELAIDQSGLYWGEYTIEECTFYSDTISVEVIENELNIGEDITLCEGESYLLNLDGVGQNINWNNGYTGNPLEITEPGMYWAEIQFNDCDFRTDTIEVTYTEQLDIFIGSHTTICQGETININIPEVEGDVVWSNGYIGNNIIISESGLYWAEYTINGCTYSTDTIVIQVVELDIAVDTMISLCRGDNYAVILEYVGPNVNWNNGYTGNNLIISEAGLYWAEIQLESCTFQTDTIEVSMIEPIAYDMTTDTTICAGDTIVFEIGSSELDVIWSGGNLGNELTISEEGSYWGQYSIEGCMFTTDTVSVTIAQDEYAIEESVSICEGDIYQLDLDGVGEDVFWNSGAVGSEIEIFEAGEYWAEIILGNCQIETNILTVDVLLAENIDIGSDTLICGKKEVRLSAINSSADILWSTGEVGNSILIQEEGYYWAASLSECSGLADTIEIQLVEDPNLVFDLDTLICLEEEYMLPFTNTEISWQTIEGESTTMVSESGKYLGMIQIDECVFQTDTLKVDFIDCTPCTYDIPNVISPNGDGYNDVLSIFFSDHCNIIDFEMSVFDRWGNLMHRSKENSWNGEYNSSIVENGVYVYYVKLTIANSYGALEELSIFGDVTVIK